MRSEKDMKKTQTRLAPFFYIAATLILLLLIFLSLGIGRYSSLGIRDVFVTIWDSITTGDFTGTSATVLFQLRLPRILLAVLVGTGLSVSGASFQGLFANPLATPDTIGVASGASFGAALGLLMKLSPIGIQLMSFSFGLVSMSASFLIGVNKKKNRLTIILAGILIGSFFSALLSLVKFTADEESTLPAITYFLMGSFAGASYDTLLVGLIPIAIGLVILFLLRFRMNLLPYEEEDVRAMGVRIRTLRLLVAFAATLITSASVSLAGQVGWIGLLIPHIARLRFKNNFVTLIPVTAFLGAIFMLIVDTICRSVSASEIPLSVLTSILGMPFFLYFIRKKGGWTL